METSLGSSPERLQPPSAGREDTPGGIRLVLAGHHPLTLFGLSQILSREGDCRVLATCTRSEAVLEALRRHRPDILILDVELPRNGSLSVLREMRRERLLPHVILLADVANSVEVIDGIRLGARAVVLKEMPPTSLIACVRKVHDGEECLSEVSAPRVVSRVVRARSSQQAARQLTRREAEIARLAAAGIPTKEIAARLDVKDGTVKIHLHSIYDKLKVEGRLGLILFARRRRLS